MGGIIWPIMLTQITKLTSFANAIRVTAAVTTVLLLIANFAIKTRHSQTSHHQKLNFKNIFREKGYLICIVAAFCNGLGIFFPCATFLLRMWLSINLAPEDFYLQLYAIKKGVNKELAFYVVRHFVTSNYGAYFIAQVAILNAGSFVGRLFTNIFTDRVGVYNMTIPSLILSSILAFSIFGLHSFASVSIFGALYGFWSGACEHTLLLWSLIRMLIRQLSVDASLTPSLLAQLSAHADDPGYVCQLPSRLSTWSSCWQDTHGISVLDCRPIVSSWNTNRGCFTEDTQWSILLVQVHHLLWSEVQRFLSLHRIWRDYIDNGDMWRQWYDRISLFLC